MTQPNPATKTRAEIAQYLARFLDSAEGRTDLIRTGVGIADGSLIANGYTDDHRWLCEHFSRVRLSDGAGMAAIARRLIERLTIEGDDLADDSNRAVDSLITDSARHLAMSGDREAILAHMRTLDVERLAHLVTDALVKLSDRDRLVDEVHQLRAQLNIKQAKAEHAVAVSA